MPIVGLGVDVTPVDRIRAAWERHGTRLLAKLFHPGEVQRDPALGEPFVEHVAGRFAAKEAAMKALGTGWGKGVGWKSLKVERARGEAPRLVLLGEAARLAARRGANRCHLTITHGGGVAVAVVVLEAVDGGDPPADPPAKG